jgi:BirA family biotin operon repressor/biotin-[acetyl-CoA-carboxylase] ligase
MARVRWPNDIVADGRKLAGVLVETKFKGNELDYAVLGVGINANFPISVIGEVDQESTSLLDLVGSPVNRESLISSILYEIEYLNELISSNHPDVVVSLLERLECSRGKNVMVRLQQGEISGVFEGYEGLAKVRIATHRDRGTIETIDTSAVISAEYRNR